MRFKYPILIILSSLVISVVIINGQTVYRPEGTGEAIVAADIFIKARNSKNEHVDNIVKVVYFHAADQKPLNNWRERLAVTLKDVSKFYSEEFAKHGVASAGIPFEMAQDGQLMFHLIQGSLPSEAYNENSGLIIQREISDQLSDQIDFSKDHVLIVNGLCDKGKDGTYYVHSPYRGGGSAVRGVCFVADCELLDSRLLSDTTTMMTLTEMFVTDKKCTVAEFNSWYIGGIAHEMGHVFGLPHDFGNPLELNERTISLMGEHGSRHYREYLWNGQKSSAISSSGILQLLGHPIFAHTKKIQSKSIHHFNLKGLKFDRVNSELVLNLDYQTSESPYGFVALVRPENKSEYFSESYSKFNTSKNSLSIGIGNLSGASYRLQLLFLFPDGSVVDFQKAFVVDESGNAKEQRIGNRRVDIGELYEKISKMEKTPVVEQKLQILDGILNPSEPIDLLTCTEQQLYLSDAKWEKAMVGWEKPARNHYTCENEFTFFLENVGKLYEKGLFAHSPSLYEFNLGGKWRSFSAVVGLRDYAHMQGSVRFKVIGDGRVLYESPVLRVNQQEKVEVNIENVKILELKADGTEGHNYNSWAVWLDPMLEK